MAMALVTAGPMHRLGLAVQDSAEAAGWFGRVLGAGGFEGKSVVPHQELTPSVMADIRRDEGSNSRILWLGGYPLLLLAPLGDDGYANQFLRRWGPGVHSLAWEIEDMWGADQRLRQRGIGITGVNIPGRHFFMHPRDTHGLLLEFTDTWFKNDPRRGGPDPNQIGGVVGGDVDVAWVTAVVRDAGATAELLAEVAGASTVAGNARRDASIEDARDLRIGDLTLRLVTPLAAESRYHEVLAGGPRLFSYTLRVSDLGDALKALEGEGVITVDRDGDLAVTDRATTLGVPMEWTA
jgi:Glyoxalase/Bleomycin resistance protein/Dioxygenase superfamily